jgi:hypothetical protein
MSGGRDRRLARLEQARLEQAELEQDRRPPTRIFHLWRDGPRDSARDAIARSFPNPCPRARSS